MKAPVIAVLWLVLIAAYLETSGEGRWALLVAAWIVALWGGLEFGIWLRRREGR
jgi:hypothetical protein